MKCPALAQVSGVLLGVTWLINPAAAEPPILPEAAAQVVAVAELSVQDGTVSGSLVNKSTRVVRDVRLLIRHAWVWKDERHPGVDSPGTAEYYTVSTPIPPASQLRFTHAPSPPLPQRADGHFETSVEVVGFAEVGE
jgi:hypothetical protein